MKGECKMKLKSWFLGICFILAACLVIVGKLGYLPGIHLFGLIATVFLVAIIIQSAMELHFGGILFPIALLGIIYAEPLGIKQLVPWPILIAAFLGTIGFTLLFRRSIHHTWKGKSKTIDEIRIEDEQENFEQVVNEPDESTVNCSVRFGSIIKYVNTEDFKRGVFDCSFGGMKIYFDGAKIQEEAEIYVDCSFGAVSMYIPKNWYVVDNIHTSLSGVEFKNRPDHHADKKVILKGKVSFAGVEIIYI